MVEKRSFIRFPLNLDAELYPLSSGQPNNSCRITDISRKGCRIEDVPLPLPVESQIRIKTRLPLEQKTIELNAKVQWCTQSGERGPAGCTIQEIAQGEKFDLLDLAYREWRAGIK